MLSTVESTNTQWSNMPSTIDSTNAQWSNMLSTVDSTNTQWSNMLPRSCLETNPRVLVFTISLTLEEAVTAAEFGTLIAYLTRFYGSVRTKKSMNGVYKTKYWLLFYLGNGRKLLYPSVKFNLGLLFTSVLRALVNSWPRLNFTSGTIIFHHSLMSSQYLYTNTLWSNVLCTVDSTNTQWSNMLSTVNSLYTNWSNMLSTVDSTNTQRSNMLSTVDSTNSQWSNMLSTVNSLYTQWSNMLSTVDSTNTQWSNMLSSVDSTNTQWSNMLSTVDSTNTQRSNMLSTVDSTNSQWSNMLSMVESIVHPIHRFKSPDWLKKVTWHGLFSTMFIFGN